MDGGTDGLMVTEGQIVMDGWMDRRTVTEYGQMDGDGWTVRNLLSTYYLSHLLKVKIVNLSPGPVSCGI